VSDADEQRLKTLLARLEELRSRLDAASADPDQALSLLGEVNDLALEATQELDRARQSARDAQEDEE
jgi:hypothetical protein